MESEETTFQSKHDGVRDIVTAQFQVLTNGDLLHEVFDHFYVRPRGIDCSWSIPAPESKHLLWAGLVCKAFYEPAMDVLWRFMDSWTAFLRLIPTISLENLGSVFTTTGVMTESGMQRLLAYTRRVRSLTIKKFYQSVSTHIYFFMTQFCRTDTLFPALASLFIPELSELSCDNFNALYLPTASNLSYLRIGKITTEREIVAASVLSHNLLAARSLRVLCLSGKLTQATFDLLVGLKKLEVIALYIKETIFTADLLEIFSQLMSLKTLTIELANNSRIASIPTSPVIFESLRDVSLGGPANNVYNFLQSVRFVHLDSLSLDFFADSLVPYIQSCLSRCSELGVLSSLTFFKVDKVSNPEVALVELESSVVLHSCKNLEYLDIPVISMTKSTIRDRFRHCQLLKTLQLRCHQLPANDSGLSLYDLREFAEHFKNLETLSISLANILASPDDIQLLEACLTDPLAWAGHDLENLEILPITTKATHLPDTTKKYTYKEAILVSQYIDSLFPRLKKLVFPTPTNPWVEEVKALLTAYQAVRKRESLKKCYEI